MQSLSVIQISHPPSSAAHMRLLPGVIRNLQLTSSRHSTHLPNAGTAGFVWQMPPGDSSFFGQSVSTLHSLQRPAWHVPFALCMPKGHGRLPEHSTHLPALQNGCGPKRYLYFAQSASAAHSVHLPAWHVAAAPGNTPGSAAQSPSLTHSWQLKSSMQRPLLPHCSSAVHCTHFEVAVRQVPPGFAASVGQVLWLLPSHSTHLPAWQVPAAPKRPTGQGF